MLQIATQFSMLKHRKWSDKMGIQSKCLTNSIAGNKFAQLEGKGNCHELPQHVISYQHTKEAKTSTTGKCGWNGKMVLPIGFH
jgi:hypothetical protein